MTETMVSVMNQNEEGESFNKNTYWILNGVQQDFMCQNNCRKNSQAPAQNKRWDKVLLWMLHECGPAGMTELLEQLDSR